MIPPSIFLGWPAFFLWIWPAIRTMAGSSGWLHGCNTVCTSEHGRFFIPNSPRPSSRSKHINMRVTGREVTLGSSLRANPSPNRGKFPRSRTDRADFSWPRSKSCIWRRVLMGKSAVNHGIFPLKMVGQFTTPCFIGKSIVSPKTNPLRVLNWVDLGCGLQYGFCFHPFLLPSKD